MIPAPAGPGIHAPGPRWYEVLLAVALVLFFGSLAIAGAALLQKASPEAAAFWSRDGRAAILLLPLEAAILLAACWLALFRGAGAKWSVVVGMVPLRRRWIGRSILAGFGLFVGAIGVALVLEQVLDRPLRAPTPADLGLGEASAMRFAFILLMGGYAVPLAEEVLFRGLIFRWLLEKLGFAPAALLSGAVFGAAHFGNGSDHTWITAAYGVVFAWLYWRSGSLWAPVLAHRVTNTIALTLAWLAADVVP